MRLLLLGATGRTGKFVLRHALDAGYDVHVVVRDKTKVDSNTRLSIFKGTLADKVVLYKAAADWDT